MYHSWDYQEHDFGFDDNEPVHPDVINDRIHEEAVAEETDDCLF